MSAITQFFFRAPYPAPTTWTVFRWWESRRMAYNLAVGGAGVVSLAAVALFDMLPPHARGATIPWGGVLVYGVLANVCFTLGPLVDAWVCRRWGPTYAPVGAALFRYGFAFATGLTLLPIPLSFVGWMLRLLGIAG